METSYDQILDSPSKNSYIGSYYQPPDRIVPFPKRLDFQAHSSTDVDPQMSSPHKSPSKHHIDSRAVVDALKTLQQKIRRLELERKQAEKVHQQFSLEAQNDQQATTSSSVSGQPATSLPEKGNVGKNELDSKLQSAEKRCKILEKQLDYMRKMVESAKTQRNAFLENQGTQKASLQNQQASSSNTQSQQEKLEKLESECLKLSRTQTQAETKLAMLEQKLLREEHERQLVQEKADKLQRELDINLRLSVSSPEETRPKKKVKKKTTKKTSHQNAPASPSGPRLKRLPFVAGTSTSPSHSVHANVQSILHMMKHHQPQLCERVGALHRSAKKSLHKAFPPAPATSRQPDLEQAALQLGSLSDLLLALQDELGQMSFEHQELAEQIDATEPGEQRQDLQGELERLVTRMEEKGAQITKLRRHQQTVHKLSKGEGGKKTSGIQPPAPSPVKPREKRKKGGATHNNLQLLRETQRLRSSLKQDDLSWET